MGGSENSVLTRRPMALPARYEVSGFLPLLMLFYGFLPLADIVSGALSTFYEIGWFATAYKAGSLLLLMLFAIAGRIRTGYAAFSVVIITLLILGAGVRQSTGYGGLSDDMVFIARGPILLSAILIVMMSLGHSEVEKVARIFFVSTWFATTLSIFITNWLGISLVTYNAGYGAKGFYQAANEVTLGFVLSWWYMQTRMVKNLWQSGLIFLSTLFLIYTLGTKSGFVVIPILGLWYIGRWLRFNRFANLFVFLSVSLITSIFAGSIFLAVLPYLPAAESSIFFINTYGVDTTLTGGRFIDLDAIIRFIETYSFGELLFGMGFENFWFAIDGSSVESDLIDTLGGGGIIFAGWFYGMLLWGYKCSKAILPNGKAIDTEWSFVFIAAIMYSIFVGHVAFAATPLITLAMFLALAYKERPIEDRARSVVV